VHEWSSIQVVIVSDKLLTNLRVHTHSAVKRFDKYKGWLFLRQRVSIPMSNPTKPSIFFIDGFVGFDIGMSVSQKKVTLYIFVISLSDIIRFCQFVAETYSREFETFYVSVYCRPTRTVLRSWHIWYFCWSEPPDTLWPPISPDMNPVDYKPSLGSHAGACLPHAHTRRC